MGHSNAASGLDSTPPEKTIQSESVVHPSHPYVGAVQNTGASNDSWYAVHLHLPVVATATSGTIVFVNSAQQHLWSA